MTTVVGLIRWCLRNNGEFCISHDRKSKRLVLTLSRVDGKTKTTKQEVVSTKDVTAARFDLLTEKVNYLLECLGDDGSESVEPGVPSVGLPGEVAVDPADGSVVHFGP